MAELTVTSAETDRILGAPSQILARGPYGEISLSFRRTSKVPSNGQMFYTPDLGPFPLYSVNKFRGLPSSVRKAGGWFIAIRDQEAMFIDFDSKGEFAVSVGSTTSKKAHCLVNGRYCLDGLPDSNFPNCVRQFLAAPAPSRSRNKPDDETVVGSLLLDIKPSKAVFVVPDQLSTFTIDVKMLTGKTLQVDVNNLTTCAQLKTAIQDLEGIPPDQQRIIFDGALLTDGNILSSHKVMQGSILHLVLRLRGGGQSIARPFASHKMTLKSGGLIWQPQACTEVPQVTYAETSTLIPIHILNAERVRAWTGIDPPPSLVDPELYVTVGIPFVPEGGKAEELVKQNATLYRQLYEHTYGAHADVHSGIAAPGTRLKDDNPFTAIKSRNSKAMIDKYRSNKDVSSSSSTNISWQNGQEADQNSRKKRHWWSKMFQ